MVKQTLSDRLAAKTVKQSIITNISKDFNLTPLLIKFLIVCNSERSINRLNTRSLINKLNDKEQNFFK